MDQQHVHYYRPTDWHQAAWSRKDMSDELTTIFGTMKSHDIRIALVMLEGSDKKDAKWIYSFIKNLGDIQKGVQTVCVKGNKLVDKRNPERPNHGLIGNVAMKFNIKMGGINQRMIGLDDLSPLDSETMVVGVDVTHPSPGSSEQAKSIVAVVASENQDLAQWPASFQEQKSRQEILANFLVMMKERLQHWKSKNQESLPTKVIVYRDGVSEGQYKAVVEYEIEQMNEAFKAIYDPANKPRPKVTFIVVGKRHNTRFFPATKSTMDEPTGNCRAGTVVDRSITSPYIHDFFLQAHQGLKGTAKPAHYVVCRDDIFNSADLIQTFTHNMCYMYNRATKAISVCPPAYYAHLACERARLFMFNTYIEPGELGFDTLPGGGSTWNHEVNERLRGTTFYI
ncbi:stem cell self-renewal protein Piwi [Myriangium duriaei CBS 260.36]|uniref:Stem cell self-renewal protein Piwi n=1 Tax=Myriangium duriaei CBS 260.36 TaxID=1168546 RepID=A0A9P4J394_9PEZI|nr:stem cell self-renewal protein Piwi [Myriangium duriaei CBS 260.36]